MQRFSGSTKGMRTKTPRSIRAESTALAKSPSRPQSTATKLVAEGSTLSPFFAAISPMRPRAASTRARICGIQSRSSSEAAAPTRAIRFIPKWFLTLLKAAIIRWVAIA